MSADHHIYVRRGPENLPYLIAECEEDALAFTLRTLLNEGQLTQDSRVGILYRPDAQRPGIWLVNPWANGRETT